MPNYDFKCKECDKVFTIKKAMNEKVFPTCPVCESPNTARIWNNVNVPGSSGGCGGCSSGGSCGGNCGCK